jgi:hypothetical protein
MLEERKEEKKNYFSHVECVREKEKNKCKNTFFF